MDRRTFLARVGTVGLAGAVSAWPSAVGVARGAAYAEQPAAVTITYERDRLEQFRPLLITEALDPTRQTPELYSWIARRENRDVAVYEYWAWYPTGQDGLTDADSHRPDREPIYVGVDETTDDVQWVTYDAYHYFAFTDYDPRRYAVAHPQLYVIAPWHPYRRPRPDTADDAGQFLALADLHDRYEEWLSEGWEVSREMVLDPWRIHKRGHWWSDGVQGRIERMQAAIGLELTRMTPADFFVGAESDLV